MLRFNFKKIKAYLLVLPLTVLFFSQAAFAASYTVVSGDSLYKISNKFNTTVSYIKQINKLTSDTIYPGQVLDVPAKVYTVKSGDTLFLISKSHNISLSALRATNNKWDDLIFPGQKLLIPNASSTGGNQSGTSNKAVIPYSSYEFDLLARLITAEAEGEPYQAQVAVGAVIVNRVKDPRFPNTISGVIYEVSGGYYQFTPVLNGRINMPATQSAKNAAYEALHGADPSNGALYFFDVTATNKWLWSKPITAKIGKMVFVV
ncbi:MAG TPA: LysM peptidoglycan-binding domain-containing protein [Clostridiaceae bacterium]|nr:LysM peptidoglycan-binding domain-containing protein [Clostridiaceae bacterium]